MVENNLDLEYFYRLLLLLWTNSDSTIMIDYDSCGRRSCNNIDNDSNDIDVRDNH